MLGRQITVRGYRHAIVHPEPAQQPTPTRQRGLSGRESRCYKTLYRRMSDAQLASNLTVYTAFLPLVTSLVPAAVAAVVVATWRKRKQRNGLRSPIANKRKIGRASCRERVCKYS